jgi:hypothetical protein
MGIVLQRLLKSPPRPCGDNEADDQTRAGLRTAVLIHMALEGLVPQTWSTSQN